MDFEELINFVIVVVFIGIALLVKLIESASKKKMPPGPILKVPEETWPELEIEGKPSPFEKRLDKPEPEVKEPIRRPVKVPEKKPEVIIVPTPSSFFSRKDLQEGIILSTILGPPRSILRWRPFRY